MTFGHPLLLLSLLVLPLAVALYLWLDRRPVRHALTFTNLDVLASVIPARSFRRYLAPLLALAALAVLCLAVARPHRTVLVPSDKATVILVIDVSGSMQATDVKPTRLAAAQTAVRKFLDKVPPRVRVALVAFAGEAQVAAPPTTDREVLRAGVDSLGGFGFNGTAIGDALAVAVDLARPQPTGPTQTIAYHTIAEHKPTTTILFLSDGHQTRGLLQPLEGAARAKAAGIPVYTVALGTPNGTIEVPPGFGGGGGGGGGGYYGGPQIIPVPPDPATLSAIAKTTGGKFFDARSAKAVESAYSNLGSIVGYEKGTREATNLALALAAILLVLAGALAAIFRPETALGETPAARGNRDQPPEDQAAPNRESEPGHDRKHEESDPLRHGVSTVGIGSDGFVLKATISSVPRDEYSSGHERRRQTEEGHEKAGPEVPEGKAEREARREEVDLTPQAWLPHTAATVSLPCVGVL